MKKIIKYIPIVFFLLLVCLLILYGNIVKLKFEDFSKYLFPSNVDGKGELFKIILSVFGAIAVVYGLYISLRRAKAMEKGVEKQSESINNQAEQLELSRKSQIDERFKNAIEHLGSDKEPIILGGIAELHQIAKENKENYSEVVFNILCSYVSTMSHVYSKTADDINHKALQAIINYLFKKESNNNLYIDYFANLSHSNLLGLDMTYCNFQNCDLSFCYLPSLNNSDLRYSKLSKSIFRTPTIENADFTGSDLMDTVFHFCKIKNCKFNLVENSKTIFLACTIENVSFNNVSFHDVSFCSSYVKNISLLGSSLLSVDFSCSHLEEIDFSDLNLFGGCDFRVASFHNVNFKNIITESKFNGANYEINEYPQLYDNRLKARLNKDCEIKIRDVEYGKNDIGTFTKEDKEEIESKIKEIEFREIIKRKPIKKGKYGRLI